MKNLYNKIDNDEVICRIKQLTPSAVPAWGKMTVSQMMAHCQVAFKVTYDEVVLKRGLMGILFGQMAKKKLTSGEPFPRNMPTFTEAKIKDVRDFEVEKELLINYVSRMAAAGFAGVTQRPHPFFGKLSKNEWNTLHYLHLDHHLRQFGV